jgi:hypothetical protein
LTLELDDVPVRVCDVGVWELACVLPTLEHLPSGGLDLGDGRIQLLNIADAEPEVIHARRFAGPLLFLDLVQHDHITRAWDVEEDHLRVNAERLNESKRRCVEPQ